MADLTSNQLSNICRISYNAGLRCCALGSSVEGGRLINKSGGVAWIVAPSSTSVTRTWTSRNDAVTLAQAAAPCGDWYIPFVLDMAIALECRSFWDSICTTSHSYWTNSPAPSSNMQIVCTNLGCNSCFPTNTTTCVRAIRKVFY